MKSTEAQPGSINGQLTSFIRRKDYRIVRLLGKGACGQTVLLHDDQIDECYVCKKYSPCSEQYRAELFQNFVREIKLLHRLHHKNVVRIFNHYLYPQSCTGYILMEYVDGTEVDQFIQRSPERINDCFAQAISGFAYLESSGVLHRDIRMQNLMVTADGIVKIIDLGFGKKIERTSDFKKSISLNWPFTTPDEFAQSVYDFRTEMYFVGRLFKKLIEDNAIVDFRYAPLLARMCAARPEDRPTAFSNVDTEVQSERFPEAEFAEDDIIVYRQFATAIFTLLSKIERSAKYVMDPERVLAKLTDVFRSVSMEEAVPDGNRIVRCFLDGGYYFFKGQSRRISVETTRLFLELFRRSSPARQRIILANLHSKLDVIDRYTADQFIDDDIPF